MILITFTCQFLFNVSRQTVVTYDDTYSLGDKATFARQNGMAGCFTWSLDQVRSQIYPIMSTINTNGITGRRIYSSECDPFKFREVSPLCDTIAGTPSLLRCGISVSFSRYSTTFHDDTIISHCCTRVTLYYQMYFISVGKLQVNDQ